MYKTGVLKVDYVVLQYERFDDDAVKQVQPAEDPLETINVPSPHTGECPVPLWLTPSSVNKR